jgi:broad specificity phosphatase PhoE
LQLLLIRHALPLTGTDPALSPLGHEMAARLPAALSRHTITRVITSPQARARQTAQPLAAALGLPVDVDERFAEYDYGLPGYLPIEQMRVQDPEGWARLLRGELPDGVDVDAFRHRVTSAADDLSSTAGKTDVIALVCHGGVIGILLQRALDTPGWAGTFLIDYVSITHLEASRDGRSKVLGVNNIEHVWSLLSRSTKD